MKKLYLSVKSTNLSHETVTTTFILNDNLTGWRSEKFSTGETTTLYFKNPIPNNTIRLYISSQEFLTLALDPGREIKAQCNGTVFVYSCVLL